MTHHASHVALRASRNTERGTRSTPPVSPESARGSRFTHPSNSFNSFNPPRSLRHPSPVTCHSQAGIALIIVMISILVLGLLAGRFAYSMKVETTLARNANSETELEWLGRSGVEYARWILVQQAMCSAEPYDASTQIWAGGSSGPCSTN